MANAYKRRLIRQLILEAEESKEKKENEEESPEEIEEENIDESVPTDNDENDMDEEVNNDETDELEENPEETEEENIDEEETDETAMNTDDETDMNMEEEDNGEEEIEKLIIDDKKQQKLELYNQFNELRESSSNLYESILVIKDKEEEINQSESQVLKYCTQRIDDINQKLYDVMLRFQDISYPRLLNIYISLQANLLAIINLVDNIYGEKDEK